MRLLPGLGAAQAREGKSRILFLQGRESEVKNNRKI